MYINEWLLCDKILKTNQIVPLSLVYSIVLIQLIAMYTHDHVLPMHSAIARVIQLLCIFMNF